MLEKLFSYGTLYKENVQKELFGRKLFAAPDKLSGYKLTTIKINSPDVVATSGKDIHPIITYTGDNNDVVEGYVFTISKDELVQADSYEVAEYKRVKVILKSGIVAWAYVDANDKEGE